MAEEQIQDQGGQAPAAPQTPAAPSGQQDGQAQQNTEDIPEKFRGKSVAEVAKSYSELEKQLGKQGTSLKDYEKKLADWEAFGQFLESNPALFKQVEDEIKRASATNRPSDTKDADPGRDDTRAATVKIITDNFEKRYGLDQLPVEKRTEVTQAIATELAEMLDPGGKKPTREVLQNIPLDRLDKYLDKAYRLATVGDAAEKARAEAYLTARQNNEASFGNIPSSSANGQKGSLTEDEKKVARRMGISEEAYLKQKEAIAQQ